MSDKLAELQAIPSLQDLTHKSLSCLADLMIRRTYEAGEIIFVRGLPSAGIWFLTEGKVKLVTESMDGTEQGLCLIRPGKCFGGCPLFDARTNPATAQAITDVTLLILPHIEFEQLSQDDPYLADALLNIMINRLRHLSKLSEKLGTAPVRDRIRDCLRNAAEETDTLPVVRLTHETIAVLTGTAREVVTRHLAEMEKDGEVRVATRSISLL